MGVTAQTSAKGRVGRPGILITESKFGAIKALNPIREAMGEAIAEASSVQDAAQRLAKVADQFGDDDDLGNALFLPAIMSDMAGQLMVRGHELKDTSLEGPQANAQPVGAFLGLPWEEAIAEFKARGLISEDEFSELLGTYANRATESRQLMLEQLQKKMRENLLDALEEGQTLRQFGEAVASIELDDPDHPGHKLGITPQSPHYVETVFRTSIQSSYGAGRYRQLQDEDVREARPFVEYRTVGDSRVRPAHAALDRTVWRIDDPAWERIAPPNGFSCRCSVVSLSPEEAEGRGLTTAVPEGGEPDPGFDGPPVENVKRPLT